MFMILTTYSLLKHIKLLRSSINPNITDLKDDPKPHYRTRLTTNPTTLDQYCKIFARLIGGEIRKRRLWNLELPQTSGNYSGRVGRRPNEYRGW
jgi:hypothetical protein